MTILVLIGMVFMIILEMFHAKISLSSVLLLLLSWFRLKLLYISPIVSVRSSLTHFHSFQLFIKITFFCLYQQSKSSESEGKFRQVTKRYKKVLEAAKLVYANKTKGSITSQKLGSWDFWQISNSVLNEGKSAMPFLFDGPWLLLSASDEVKLFAKNFSRNSNLEDSGISLPIFSSRTNLKLHNISVTPKMVKKVITNLDSSKTSGLDCIPVEVLKNWVPELSYILADLFNMCLKESYFPDCWKVSLVVPVFKNVGGRSSQEMWPFFLVFSIVIGLLDQLTDFLSIF